MPEILPNDTIIKLASPYLTAEEAATYLRTTVQGIYSLVANRQYIV